MVEHLSHNQEVAGSSPAPAPKRRSIVRDKAINTGRYQTSGSVRIDLHYAHLRLRRLWTWERFQRLAGLLRVTTGELASTVCLPHSRIDACWQTNQFPLPVCLLLTLIETHVCAGYIPDPIPNPLPNLNHNDRPTDSRGPELHDGAPP